MKRLQLLLLLSLACFLLMPNNAAYAKGTQVLVPDTVRDTRSKYTAKYVSGIGHTCTAILISSTAAVTAKHCGGTKPITPAGTIYPGASGPDTPFGYMNIRYYFPHPTQDIAVIKGILRDQSKAYQYYIRPFSTKVTGYTNEQLEGFKDSEIYSYGYPYRDGVFKQYRSDGKITSYSKYLPLLSTDMPAYKGQSGSGVFIKNGNFLGIIVSATNEDEANVLPFTEDIANWINEKAS
ncbi:trypsin-like peptidase domain-containing protein [Staphylococcus ursi]|uniref:trypsin-like serine peptidase n=1 Tax=Staphylococcus sp. MI 10-1553 TaxID=1912064 RepID=UPI0013987C69|nr:trypsin-like peptidase domain-containing protein [Staphylococcus sp. MI 10-1553]QHW37990.1 trypsin-like peptidase domain-containing protein [Staphylococcus sp. MI 10-1553]